MHREGVLGLHGGLGVGRLAEDAGDVEVDLGSGSSLFLSGDGQERPAIGGIIGVALEAAGRSIQGDAVGQSVLKSRSAIFTGRCCRLRIQMPLDGAAFHGNTADGVQSGLLSVREVDERAHGVSDKGASAIHASGGRRSDVLEGLIHVARGVESELGLACDRVPQETADSDNVLFCLINGLVAIVAIVLKVTNDGE